MPREYAYIIDEMLHTHYEDNDKRDYYENIISTIIDRGYVYERGRALIPSWLAFSVVKLLETKFPKYVDYQSPPIWRMVWTRIAHGMEPARSWLTSFYFGSGEGAGAVSG